LGCRVEINQVADPAHDIPASRGFDRTPLATPIAGRQRRLVSTINCLEENDALLPGQFPDALCNAQVHTIFNKWKKT
jgi:hypothetical protein